MDDWWRTGLLFGLSDTHSLTLLCAPEIVEMLNTSLQSSVMKFLFSFCQAWRRGATWISIGIGVFHYHQTVSGVCLILKKDNHGFLFLLNWLLKPLPCILTLGLKFKGCINPGRGGTFGEFSPEIKKDGWATLFLRDAEHNVCRCTLPPLSLNIQPHKKTNKQGNKQINKQKCVQRLIWKCMKFGNLHLVAVLVNCSQFVTHSCPKLPTLFAAI